MRDLSPAQAKTYLLQRGWTSVEHDDNGSVMWGHEDDDVSVLITSSGLLRFYATNYIGAHEIHALALSADQTMRENVVELARKIIQLSDGQSVPDTVLLPDTPAGREAAARIQALNEERGFESNLRLEHERLAEQKGNTP